LLALSTTCHFCTQSGPFYQRVVKEHGDAQLVVLVLQAISLQQHHAHLQDSSKSQTLPIRSTAKYLSFLA
jgi:hypothetical protein